MIVDYLIALDSDKVKELRIGRDVRTQKLPIETPTLDLDLSLEDLGEHLSDLCASSELGLSRLGLDFESWIECRANSGFGLQRRRGCAMCGSRTMRQTCESKKKQQKTVHTQKKRDAHRDGVHLLEEGTHGSAPRVDEVDVGLGKAALVEEAEELGIGLASGNSLDGSNSSRWLSDVDQPWVVCCQVPKLGHMVGT